MFAALIHLRVEAANVVVVTYAFADGITPQNRFQFVKPIKDKKSVEIERNLKSETIG